MNDIMHAIVTCYGLFMLGLFAAFLIGIVVAGFRPTRWSDLK